MNLDKNQITITVYSTVTTKRSLKKLLDLMIDIAEKTEGTELSTDIALEYDKKWIFTVCNQKTSKNKILSDMQHRKPRRSTVLHKNVGENYKKIIL